MNRRQRILAAQAHGPTQRTPVGRVLAVIGTTVGVVVLMGFATTLVGLILLASPIAVPLVLLFNWRRQRRFLTQHAGERLLVVSRRRAWRDFIVNNVEPVLPDRTSCVWQDSLDSKAAEVEFIVRRLKRSAGLKRPYLIVISEGPPRMHIVPMHDALLPLKRSAKVSDETRRLAAAAIEAEIERPRR